MGPCGASFGTTGKSRAAHRAGAESKDSGSQLPLRSVSTHPNGVIHVMMHPRCALLAVVLLAACGSEGCGEGPDHVAPGSASGAVAAVADTAPPAAAAARSAPVIVLAPEGLSVTGGTAPKQLAFGSPQAAVLAEVGGVLGAP